jgi:hypothetical protein
MPISSSKLGKFLLTAGLLVILAQGLWQLPAIQDHFFPGNQWELDLMYIHNESWKIKNRLTALKLRLDYLNWLLVHRETPQAFSMDWMVDFPFSESIRLLSPKFICNFNIFLAHRDRSQIQRKLTYIDALVNYIQLHKIQTFSVYLNEILLNKDEFQREFAIYNREITKLGEQLMDPQNNPCK